MNQQVIDLTIMSDVELNLCVRMLGIEDWYDIPVADDGRNLNELLLKGLTALYNEGFLCTHNDKYTPSEKLISLFRLIYDRKAAFLCMGSDGKIIHMYVGEGQILCMEEADAYNQVRIFSLSCENLFSFLFEDGIQELLNLNLQKKLKADAFKEEGIILFRKEPLKKNDIVGFARWQGNIWFLENNRYPIKVDIRFFAKFLGIE